MIDKDEALYPVHLLRRWRAMAESHAQQNCGVRARPIETAPDPDGILTCPFCGTESRLGLLVCRGCHADIVYRATQLELKEAMSLRAMLVLAPLTTLVLAAQTFDAVSRSMDLTGWLTVAVVIGLFTYGAAMVSAFRLKNRLANVPRFIRQVPL